MKTIYKISFGVLCVSLFLGLAVLGFNVTIETKPATVQAADTTVTFLAGDKDGFGINLGLGASYSNINTFTPSSFDPSTMDRPLVASSWSASAASYPLFTSPNAAKPSTFTITTNLPAGATITSAKLDINVADIDDNEPSNNNINDKLTIDGQDIAGAFDTTNQFVSGVAGLSGVVSFTLNNSMVQSALSDNTMTVLIDEPTRNGQMVTNPNLAEVFAIDYAELTLTYSTGPTTSNLVVSCTAIPTSTTVNQSVSFNSSVAGGNNVYSYAWTGACTAGSQNCSASFAQPGTYTASLSVTSGTQTATTSCNVAVANTGTITCSTDSQCGTSGYTGSPSCSAGNVFQNYLNYAGTCKNANTTASYCDSPTSTYQQKTVCGSGLSCSNGACVNTGNSGGSGNLGVSCNANPGNIQANQSTTFNSSAVGGSGVYSYAWSGACNAGSANCSASFSQAGTYTALLSVTSGNQTQNASCSVGVSGNNNNNNTCYNTNYTYNSYQQCKNGSVHWFDSCGVDQGISQACNGNQTCTGNVCVNQNINYNYGNVYVTTQVRNLSSGNLNWSTSVSANPSDILQYQITLQNNSNVNLNNVTVRDTLPANLLYSNNLMIDGAANGGNIIFGVNIGSLSPNQTRTVTYQVQVGPAQNFVFGTTTLTSSTSVTSNNGTNGTSSTSVSVNRSGVLGATSVPTGLTNNPIVDSFFLPLILALLGVWAYKSGWFSKRAELAANAKLQSRIAAIRNKENA